MFKCTLIFTHTKSKIKSVSTTLFSKTEWIGYSTLVGQNEYLLNTGQELSNIRWIYFQQNALAQIHLFIGIQKIIGSLTINVYLFISLQRGLEDLQKQSKQFLLLVFCDGVSQHVSNGHQAYFQRSFASKDENGRN